MENLPQDLQNIILSYLGAYNTLKLLNSGKIKDLSLNQYYNLLLPLKQSNKEFNKEFNKLKITPQEFFIKKLNNITTKLTENHNTILKRRFEILRSHRINYPVKEMISDIIRSYLEHVTEGSETCVRIKRGKIGPCGTETLLGENICHYCAGTFGGGAMLISPAYKKIHQKFP